MSAAEFVTFWHGPLNPMVEACLASFPAQGARLAVYGYERPAHRPAGVEWLDARQICPDISLLGRFLVDGKPSIAAFSDYFRYRLLARGAGCWVDTDILCLGAPGFGDASVVWGRQPEAHGKALINNAVLKLPPDHPVLLEMRARAEAAIDQDLSWGAIGPFLLTEVAEAHGVYATSRPPRDFYPIDPDDFGDPLLPGRRALVEAAVAGARFLHLWSELLRRCGYDAQVCPPAGSYLHEAFAGLGVTARFSRIYEEREVEDMLRAWKAGRPK